jgi:DNA-binding transcriptional regulator YdaS (Cro superfamily)
MSQLTQNLRILAVVRPTQPSDFGAPNASIHKAIELLGSQQALAKECGVTRAAVSKWSLGRRVSAESAMAIHKATNGEIALHDLRPDLWPITPDPHAD